MVVFWAVLGVFEMMKGSKSPATHNMCSMDPYKTDTDEFQQILPLGDGKICLKVAMLSL
jgi:hypothetical protein